MRSLLNVCPAPLPMEPSTLTKLDHSPAVGWYVVSLFSRLERKAAAALNKAGFGVYLPERKIETQHRRTKKWQEHSELVMPGYGFVEFPAVPDHEWFDRGARPTWHALVSCDGVLAPLGTIDAAGELVPIRISSRLVERMMADQTGMLLDDTREARRRNGVDALEEKRAEWSGATVRVTDGPFASFPATVDAVDSLERLHVLITIFGRDTPVQLEFGQVELMAA